jgi:uncharacterized protein (DUF433 family)
MSIDISAESAKFLEAAVAQGAFSTREEALDRAVRLLRERHEAIERIKSRAVSFPELPTELGYAAGGVIRFQRTRIGLDLVLARHFAGDTIEQIHDSFPTVPFDALRTALAYMVAHEPLARAYLDQQQALASLHCDEAHHGPSVNELRQRFQAQMGSSSV